MEPALEPHYHAFLIRLWRDGDRAPWRISVKNAHTGESRFFSSLDELLAFLARMAGNSPEDKSK